MPPGVWTTASISLPVLTLWIRTFVSGAVAAIIPASIANGPTPASMLPQLGEMSTVGSSTLAWANR